MSNLARVLSLVAFLLLPYVSPSLLYSSVVTFGEGDRAFEIEFVSIGNPGNPDDPRVRLSTPDLPAAVSPEWPAGGVGYEFGIGKFEISLEIVKIVEESAGIGVRLTQGYDRLTPSGVIPRDAGPALISWTEAAHVVNWLNTSQGYPPAYKFPHAPHDPSFLLLDDGFAWSQKDPGYDPDNVFRNGLSRYALPSIDEWHKAAYYDPAKGEEGGYWLYATGSDTPPRAVASGVEPNTAVYGQSTDLGPANVERAGGLNPFGLMGMGGNAREYTENSAFGLNRDFRDARDNRGQRWDTPTPSQADRNVTTMTGPLWNGAGIGFRVVDLLPTMNQSGDISGDHMLTALDIDLLTIQVSSMVFDARFDVNGDGIVNREDRVFWVEQIATTHFGDADLNGVVEFNDFVSLAGAFNMSSGWASGDFDGSGVTDFADFSILSDNFGRRAAVAVPEPSVPTLICWGVVLSFFKRLSTRIRS